MTIEIRRAGLGFYWRIVASNGRVLAHSETYRRRGAARRAAESVIAEVHDAELVDLTSERS